jgi:hypothetical protein
MKSQYDKEDQAVPTTRNLSIALASCLGLALVTTPLRAADGEATAKKPAAGSPDAKPAGGAAAPAKDPSAPAMPANLSDSPYATGAPAVTGGYTDTTQGGKKGSGDPNAIPPMGGAGQPPAAK